MGKDKEKKGCGCNTARVESLNKNHHRPRTFNFGEACGCFNEGVWLLSIPCIIIGVLQVLICDSILPQSPIDTNTLTRLRSGLLEGKKQGDFCRTRSLSK